MKYCQKCGKEIMDETVICPGCGGKVADEKHTNNAGNDGLAIAAKIFLILGCIAQ